MWSAGRFRPRCSGPLRHGYYQTFHTPSQGVGECSDANTQGNFAHFCHYLPEEYRTRTFTPTRNVRSVLVNPLIHIESPKLLAANALDFQIDPEHQSDRAEVSNTRLSHLHRTLPVYYASRTSPSPSPSHSTMSAKITKSNLTPSRPLHLLLILLARSFRTSHRRIPALTPPAKILHVLILSFIIVTKHRIAPPVLVSFLFEQTSPERPRSSSTFCRCGATGLNVVDEFAVPRHPRAHRL